MESLKELCKYLPLNKKDLIKISGFGKAKVDKYGDEVLTAIEDYCTKYGIFSNMDAKSDNPKNEVRKSKVAAIATPKEDTKTISYNLYKQGKIISDISKERNLSTSTIESHLSYFIGEGLIPINDLVSNLKQALIKDAVKIHGALSLKILSENLPPTISYGDIKMVLSLEK
jgi:ATP-dependent DNA helicase RecQ